MNVHGDSNHQNWAEPSDTHWRIATVRRWNLHLDEKDFCCKSQWWAIKILSGFFFEWKSPDLEHFLLQQFPTLFWMCAQLRIQPSLWDKVAKLSLSKVHQSSQRLGWLFSTNKTTQGLLKRQGKYVPANSENCSQGQLPEGAFPEPESVLTNKTYKKEQEQW